MSAYTRRWTPRRTPPKAKAKKPRQKKSRAPLPPPRNLSMPGTELPEPRTEPEDHRRRRATWSFCSPARLRRARELAGLSVGQVAELLGCDRLVVELAEGRDPNGNSEAYAAMRARDFMAAQRFADLYGCTLDYLEGYEAPAPADLEEKLAKLPPEERGRVLEVVSLGATRPEPARPAPVARPAPFDAKARAAGDD